jgi:hypothetical protein
VRGFVKQYADGEFDPDTIGILTQAFDDAWQSVQLSKRPYVAEEYTEVGRIITSSPQQRQGSAIPAGWLTARSSICRGRNCAGSRRPRARAQVKIGNGYPLGHRLGLASLTAGTRPPLPAALVC